MTELLNQALILTLVGMGMTFAALGLLVLGMYAMTAFISDRPRRKENPLPEAQGEEALMTQVADVVLHIAAFAGAPAEETATVQPQDGERQRAAAVAVALALEDATPHPDNTAGDARYRAAAAAVIVALAEHDLASAIPTPSPTMPDAWNYHTRAYHLARHHHPARTLS